ncbi:MAG: hypothetical protein QOE36_1091 [Gaiellaceae bacterium]|jgi:hypothetical protein|nr:hypothetical protein [Gaiellaceae bacterium]
MKRALGAAALVLCTTLIVAAMAQATASKPPAYATAARVTALEAKVTKLQKQLSTVGGVVSNCLVYKTLPVNDYGDPPTGEGYVYQKTTGPVVTTALDIAGQGDTVDFEVALINPSCITTTPAFRAKGARAHRQVALSALLHSLRAPR